MRYVYAPDTVNPGSIMNLPAKWTDPITGIQYSNFNQKSDSELNALSWYAVNEVVPSATQYEKITLSSIIFDEDTKTFTATYTASYRTLEEVRQIKLDELLVEFQQLKDNLFANMTENEIFEQTLRSIALLASGKTAANNTFLQGVVNTATNFTTDRNALDARRTIVKNSSDIPTIIAT